MCVSFPVLPFSPPLVEVSLRQTENQGQGEREPRHMREWFSFYTLSPAVLPLCAAITLSLFFPHLTPPPICPPPPFSPCCLGSILRQLQPSRQPLHRKGDKHPLPLLSLLCHSIALPLFLMIYLSFIHKGCSQEIGGKKSIFFSKDLISLCSSHCILPLLFVKFRLTVLQRTRVQ